MTPANLPDDARRNRLLDRLPEADRLRWAPRLEPVELPLGALLSEPGRSPAYAVFPTSAIVSLLYLTRDGASSELAVVGRDGMVGMSLVMGGDATPGCAIVQSAGRGYRVPAAWLRGEVEHGGPVQTMLLRYAQTLLGQVAQTAVCNRYHSIDQQLCRRLLLALDRSTPGAELAMTQEAVAQMLGVRREGITAAALRLQRAGIISYRRGHIAVLDRPQLEDLSCECYGATRRDYDRLLPAARVPALQ